MGHKQIITAPDDDGNEVVVATVEFKTGTYTDANGREQEEEIVDMVIYDKSTQKPVQPR